MVHLQVPECARLALEAINDKENPMAVVIGLQSTGEANVTSQRDEEGDELEDFVSAPKMILINFLRRHFPVESALVDNRTVEMLTHSVRSLNVPATLP
jgi:hypothetical protein